MSVFLHALAVRNFRGIGHDYQQATGFTDFNFFIGPNNAGKSTILDAIARYLPITQDQLSYGKLSKSGISTLDVHNVDANRSDKINVSVGIPEAIATEFVYQVFSRETGENDDNVRNTIESIIKWLSKEGFLWLENTAPYQDSVKLRFPRDHNEARSVMGEADWGHIWSKLTRQSNGSFQQRWYPGTIWQIISEQPIDLPTASLIPAWRRIGSKGEDFGDFSGSGLIDRLAELQNPDHDKRQEAKLFENINGFLRTVINHPKARIEVPHDRRHLLVDMDDRVLPLENLGTGIHHVIMLAAFCTITQQQIVCLTASAPATAAQADRISA